MLRKDHGSSGDAGAVGCGITCEGGFKRWAEVDTAGSGFRVGACVVVEVSVDFGTAVSAGLAVLEAAGAPGVRSAAEGVVPAEKRSGWRTGFTLGVPGLRTAEAPF